jgi:hypothetical protein
VPTVDVVHVEEVLVGSHLVVGVDDSPLSLATARYSAGWAAARAGQELLLLHGCPYTLGAGIGTVPLIPAASPPPQDGEEMLRRVADGLTARHRDLSVVIDQIPAAAGRVRRASRWARGRAGGRRTGRTRAQPAEVTV